MKLDFKDNKFIYIGGLSNGKKITSAFQQTPWMLQVRQQEPVNYEFVNFLLLIVKKE
jgi:hypothetical protein